MRVNQEICTWDFKPLFMTKTYRDKQRAEISTLLLREDAKGVDATMEQLIRDESVTRDISKANDSSRSLCPSTREGLGTGFWRMANVRLPIGT